MDKKSWSVFNNWKHVPAIEASPRVQMPATKVDLTVQDWQVFSPLLQAFEKCYEVEKKEILDLLDLWNKKLEMFDGDPSFRNWRRFRPLTMDREEDWSDWLAHLIETSKTSFFTRVLFSLSLSEGSPAIVDREIEYDGYRADIVIKYGNGHFLHVEVKIGDPNLEKTYETAKKMRQYYRPGTGLWTDFILLLDSQVSQWGEIRVSEGEKFPHVTWTNVTIALRRALLFSAESDLWKAWAYAFIGAIEQKLLNHPLVDMHKREIRGFYSIDSMITILKGGLENEN